MLTTAKRRLRWGLVFAVIVAAGLGSRLIATGWVIFDKYLGDALYAAMIYALLRMFIDRPRATVFAALLMLAVECFQLTMIPARLVASDGILIRLLGWLLGTRFDWLDLLAYGVGIGAIYLVDRAPLGRATVS